MKLGVWWRIAWRNLWRNRKRTLITSGGLAFGFMACVLVIGLSEGIVSDMVRNGTRTLTGQLQVHASGWLPARDVAVTLDAAADSAVQHSLRQIGSVTALAPRVYGGGLISLSDRTEAGVLLGYDGAREARVSTLLNTLRRGRLPGAGAREIAIGDALATQLKAKVGSELVLVAPAADGSLGNDLFTVTGIYHTGLTDLDRSYALVPIDALRTLLALGPGDVHEIVALTTSPWRAPAVADTLSAALRQAGVSAEVRDWTRFRPELRDYAQLSRSSNFIVIAIVFAMAIFGVANTMLMSTHERRREFAVIRALGTSTTSIALMVLLEALALAVLSVCAGYLITVPVAYWLHRSPLDLSFLVSEFTMSGALVKPVFRVDMSWLWAGITAISLVITTLVAAVLPAWRASRIPPADALAGR